MGSGEQGIGLQKNPALFAVTIPHILFPTPVHFR